MEQNSLYKLHVRHIDDNRAVVTDPNEDRSFKVTTRPRRQFTQRGQRIKPRLYIGGKAVSSIQETLTHRQSIAWAKQHFGPTLKRILNNTDVKLRFSQKAGCACGCSPGFIVENASNVPFDIWMDTNG